MGKKFLALPDVPDIRDRFYEPTLAPLVAVMPVADELHILDQGTEGACTGFALAAVVNRLASRNTIDVSDVIRGRRVSPFMLYTNAKRYDEWPGADYEGSSLRGALRGFYNSGVCHENLWSHRDDNTVSVEIALDARLTSLGAYYRLRPHLPDYHAAISATGVLYVSASVHAGWDHPQDGRITPALGTALHAFALVGYDGEGFWVQNSWGAEWGNSGLAHWSYKDWDMNIQDAWVLQLAIPSPFSFGLGVKRGGGAGGSGLSGRGVAVPTRQQIEGHFVHVRNGDFSGKDAYWSSKADVQATAMRLASNDGFPHLLLYAHGGLNTPEAAAVRTAAMKQVFLDNGIYPYSVFYDTGLVETLKDVILGRGKDAVARTGGLSDWVDMMIERAIGGIGTKLWDEMKRDAECPFRQVRDGETALRLFVEAFAAAVANGKRPTTIHVVGHSTGAVLIGHLLAALERLMPGGLNVRTCSLLAPACTVDFYYKNYAPRLVSAPGKVNLERITVYNMTDSAEQDDNVATIYEKSLLYLVSNAFEHERKAPLLGMEKFNGQMTGTLPTFHYAARDSKFTRSTSHGGFDNDPFTMNDVLRNVLGAEPKRPFTGSDLDYGGA